MRLASLARKIKVPPTKLSEFLVDQKIDLTQGSNTKLTDSQVAQVLLHFGKELPSEPIIEEEEIVTETVITEITPEPLTEISSDIESPEEEIVEEKKAEPDVLEEVELPEEEIETPAADEKIEPIEEEEPEVEIVDQSYLYKHDADEDEIGLTEKAALNEKIKVIKPPKVKLQGLTVKGKIDLPEPKVKEEKTEVVDTEEPTDPNKIIYTSGPKREEIRKGRNQRNKKRDPNFNPLEAERKRKAEKERREKERKLKALKDAKANHYKKIVVQKPQADKPKKTAENATIPVKPSIKKEVPTKNPLKKFWRWMNT